MKLLLEIINLQRKTTHIPHYDEYDLEMMKNDFIDKGKAGFFSGGDVDPNDPHIFNKETFNPRKKLKADSYYQYIRMCAKYMKSNPFFPRVYEIDTELETNRRGHKRPKYKIEVLTPYSKINTQVLINTGKMICPELSELINKKISEIKNNKSTTDVKKEIMSTISNYLFEVIEQKATTSNKKLQQAVNVISSTIKKHPDFFNDASVDNFMFRLLPTGAQLVLTDPVGGQLWG